MEIGVPVSAVTLAGGVAFPVVSASTSRGLLLFWEAEMSVHPSLPLPRPLSLPLPLPRAAPAAARVGAGIKTKP